MPCRMAKGKNKDGDEGWCGHKEEQEREMVSELAQESVNDDCWSDDWPSR